MKKPAKKESIPAEYLISRLEEIQNKIEVIGARATWLLGILVLIVLALASYLAGNSEAGVLKNTAIALCLTYLLILLTYIPLLIVPKFGKPIYGTREIKALEKNVEQNLGILDKLHKRFMSLVFAIIIPAILALLAIGQSYIAI